MQTWNSPCDWISPTIWFPVSSCASSRLWGPLSHWNCLFQDGCGKFILFCFQIISTCYVQWWFWKHTDIQKFWFQILKVKSKLCSFLKYISSYLQNLILPFLEDDIKINYPVDTYSIIYEEALVYCLFSLGGGSLSRVLVAQRWEGSTDTDKRTSHFSSQNLWVQLNPLILAIVILTSYSCPRLNQMRTPMSWAVSKPHSHWFCVRLGCYGQKRKLLLALEILQPTEMPDASGLFRDEYDWITLLTFACGCPWASLWHC